MLKPYLKYIVIFLVLYFVWSLVLPFLFRINVKNIETLIKKESGLRVELGTARLRTASVVRAGFLTDKIRVYDKKDEKIFEASRPQLNISLFPLIFKKLCVNSFECDNVDTRFELRRNQLYFGDYVICFKDKPVDFRLKRAKINRHRTSLADICLEGKDFYYKESANGYFLRGDNNFVTGGHRSVINFNIRIPKKHRFGDSRVNFLIKDFRFAPLTDVSRALFDGILSLDGEVNMDCTNSGMNGYVKGLRFSMRDSAKTITFPDVVKISSLFSFKSDNVYIKDFRVESDGMNIELFGGVNNFTSSKPEVGLKIRGKSIDARVGANMMPALVVPQFNFYRLKMYPFYGKADVDLSLRGKLPEPCMDGNVHVFDAYMIKPIVGAKGFADINVRCMRKKMNIDVVVPAGGNETVYVTGDIEDYGDNKCDLRIRSTKRVRLGTAEFVLNPLHQILRFPIGPVPIMDVDGYGNINIRVIGTKKDPHIWGDFNFFDTRASFNDIHNLVLEHASGKLSFNDRDAHFVNNEGTVHGKKFFVDGICNLFGNIDFNVEGKGQPLDELMKTLSESPMLSAVKPMLPDIKECKNYVDLNLNLTGKLPNIYHIELGENLFAKGSLDFYNNSFRLSGVPVKRLFGRLDFKNFDVGLNLNSLIADGSKVDISGTVKDRLANIVIGSDSLNLREIVKGRFPELDDCRVRFKGKYQGSVDKISMKGLDCSGEFLQDGKKIDKIKILGGKFDIHNGNLRVRDFYGFVKSNPFLVDLAVNNLSDDFNIRKSKMNGNIQVKNFDLRSLNDFKNFKFLPPLVIRELDKLYVNNGNTDINVRVRNNRLDGNIELNNINFTYGLKKSLNSEALPVPIKLINGNLRLRGNRIILEKMNYLVDTMPVLVYGDVSNIFRKPRFNVHINSKLLQRTFDNYWNVDNIYPIKVKGDILLGSWITGDFRQLNTKLDCKMESNSSIYYMGAMIGDVENPIVVNSDFDILNRNVIRLNKFNYSKLISSLNNKQNVFPLMSVKGGIVYGGRDYGFNDLTVKTYAPTDARIFNILFKKPTIKHGQFTSDLRINGRSTNPLIVGVMSINGIDMPFLNTTIKDLSLDFDKNNILIKSKGEVLSNNIVFNAKMRNRFSGSYYIDSADIYTKHLDINNLISDLKQVELKTFNETSNKKVANSNGNFLDSVLFKDLSIYADSVSLEQLTAKNLVAKCSVDENMRLAVKHFDLDVSGGRISGDANLNMLNNLLRLRVNVAGVDSNDLLSNFFDLPNQIFGKLTGRLNIVTNISSDKTSRETLSGNAVFQVKDGRMPKLGSLEYLLRAGNVFKSGITGFTMNGVIDLISPLKTGEFSNIDGSIKIRDGVAEDIEIHSAGKALNLFIWGRYNLVTQVADMTVLGQLSRNVSTVLGAVGNVSLNSLFGKIPGVDLNEDSKLRAEFNKIPGIEISDKKYRKFVVDIYGDINTDDNVKSFRWIN